MTNDAREKYFCIRWLRDFLHFFKKKKKNNFTRRAMSTAIKIHFLSNKCYTFLELGIRILEMLRLTKKEALGTTSLDVVNKFRCT